jgi:predicted DNA-binding transcriptional regulator AlpA
LARRTVSNSNHVTYLGRRPQGGCTLVGMQTYLSVTDIAERTGLTLNTVKSYSQIPGRLPPHDCMTGRVKGWLPETIDAWMAQRKLRQL